MIHTDELLVSVARVPGSAIEHFGTPCVTPETMDVDVLGVLRVEYTCSLPEDAVLDPYENMNSYMIAATAMTEELDSVMPLILKSEDGEVTVECHAFSFGVVGPREAIGRCMAWKVRRF